MLLVDLWQNRKNEEQCSIFGKIVKNDTFSSFLRFCTSFLHFHIFAQNSAELFPHYSRTIPAIPARGPLRPENTPKVFPHYSRTIPAIPARGPPRPKIIFLLIFRFLRIFRCVLHFPVFFHIFPFLYIFLLFTFSWLLYTFPAFYFFRLSLHISEQREISCSAAG